MKLYSGICQQHTIYSIQIFIFVARIIYFEHFICKLDVLIVYSFVLMTPRGWQFSVEIRMWMIYDFG
jgi:hypothetical protein